MLPSLLYVNRPANQAANLTMGDPREWTADLDLAALAESMANGRPALAERVNHVLTEELTNQIDDILYRQAILRDAQQHAQWFSQLYALLDQGVGRFDSIYRADQPGYSHFLPVTERLRTAVQLQGILLDLAEKVLKHLRPTDGLFASEGMLSLLPAYRRFFSADFLQQFRKRHAEFNAITQNSCLVVGARPGNGLKIADCRIRQIEPGHKPSHVAKGARVIELDSISFQMKALELRDILLSSILSLVVSINQKTVTVLRQLCDEIGFYVGCLNLECTLIRIGVPYCFPLPYPAADKMFNFQGLTDIGLALRTGKCPTGNTLTLDDAHLIVITGANQGGKSTFLRSLGLAQVMQQSGLFVAAEHFAASVCSGIFTHFCRSEDAALDSGKLDEELRRMDRIVEAIEPDALLLMNESFSSTTEHDGSMIASELTEALIRLQTRVFFVTHLYAYARKLEHTAAAQTVLLRAERLDDGARSFLIKPGTALPTSYGLDLYRRLIDEALIVETP